MWGLDNMSIEINHLNAELNPIYHLLALLGAHHIFHVSRLRVNKSFCPTFCDCKVSMLKTHPKGQEELEQT